MHGIVLLLSLLHVAQVRAEQAGFDEASSENNMPSVVEMLAERGCNEGLRVHADLDESTLGKSNRIPVGAQPSSPGLRVSPSLRNIMPVGPCERETVKLRAKPLIWKKENPIRKKRLEEKAELARQKYKELYRPTPGVPGPRKVPRNLHVLNPNNVDTVSLRTLRSYKNQADFKIKEETFKEAKESGGDTQWFFFKTYGVRGKRLEFSIQNAERVVTAAGIEKNSITRYKDAQKFWDGYEVQCSYDYKEWFSVPTEYYSQRQTLKWELQTPTGKEGPEYLYCAYKVPKMAKELASA